MFKPKKSFYRFLAIFLVIIIFTNIFIFGLMGNNRVRAGFWNEHQGGIMTVLKGVIMFWIINLMSKNSSDDNNDNFLTSTIKKGLDAVQGGSEEENNKTTSTSKESPPEENNETSRNNKNNDKENVKNNDIVIENKISNPKEKNLLNLINKARKQKGIRPLEMNNKLVEVARKKAKDMIENDYFSHNSPVYGSPFSMIKEKGIQYGLAGENLAGAETIEGGYEGLMNSKKHKENILNPRYDEIGIGIVEGGPYGMMIVQLFIDKPDPTK